MTPKSLFQNTVILSRPGVAIFADMIKTQEKLKELTTLFQDAIYTSTS